MWLRSLLASWKSGRSRSRRLRPRQARRGARLLVEQLEDRSLPSSYSAATVSDLIADIKAANTAGGANTITLTAPTTYVLKWRNNSTNGGNGLPVIAANDNLTILGNGDTIRRQAANVGNQQFRLLEVAAGGSLTLVNLTLTGGYVSSYSWSPMEGGAVCNLGTLVLNGVTVTRNTAAGSPGVIQSGWIPSPSITAVGGAIWSSGSLALENGTLLEGNAAVGANGSVGGSSWPDGGSYVLTPSGAMGGAVYVAGGTVNISNTTFTDNAAIPGYMGNGLDPNPPPNTYGGALYVAAGNVTITASIVSGNSAQPGGVGFGGGAYVAGGTVSLVNDTVQSNTAYGGAGGGLYISKGATVYIDAFTLANVINNTAAVDPNIDGKYILT